MRCHKSVGARIECITAYLLARLLEDVVYVIDAVIANVRVGMLQPVGELWTDTGTSGESVNVRKVWQIYVKLGSEREWSRTRQARYW